MAVKSRTYLLTIRVISPWGAAARGSAKDQDWAALDRGRLKALQASIDEVAADLEDGNGRHGFEIDELISWAREE